MKRRVRCCDLDRERETIQLFTQLTQTRRVGNRPSGVRCTVDEEFDGGVERERRQPGERLPVDAERPVTRADHGDRGRRLDDRTNDLVDPWPGHVRSRRARSGDPGHRATRSATPRRFDLGRVLMPSVVTIASSTRSFSTPARLQRRAPFANEPSSVFATLDDDRLLPTPGGPTTVTSRSGRSRSPSRRISSSDRSADSVPSGAAEAGTCRAATRTPIRGRRPDSWNTTAGWAMSRRRTVPRRRIDEALHRSDIERFDRRLRHQDLTALTQRTEPRTEVQRPAVRFTVAEHDDTVMHTDADAQLIERCPVGSASTAC